MSNALDAVLAQYEKNSQGSSDSNRMSQEERMKKYFACILPQGQSQGQRRVRILPTKDGSSPFVEVYYHELQVGGKWQKFYDPGKNDNERSPLNEVHEELMATGKESDKELARQYKSRKFYIAKVVDRDAEDEGVKFWRFKHNYKNEGILDKIIPIWRQKGDITDPEKGRDLIIQLVKQKTPGGKDYTSIQTIMHDDPSILQEDAEVMSGLGRFTNLEALMLKNCVAELPESICNLKNLTLLALPNNPGLKSIPSCVKDFDNLTFINLTQGNPNINIPEDLRSKLEDQGDGFYYVM